MRLNILAAHSGLVLLLVQVRYPSLVGKNYRYALRQMGKATLGLEARIRILGFREFSYGDDLLGWVQP